MIALKQQIQLHFNLPSVLYRGEQTVLCCGYLDNDQKIDEVELLMNDEVIGQGKAIPRYCNEKMQLFNNGFSIIGQLQNIPNQKQVSFSLKTYNGSKNEIHFLNNSKLVSTNHFPKNSHQKKVVVCMPLFQPDLVRFKNQLESILTQTFKNIDIFIQDDGSPVETLVEVERIIEVYANVHLSKNDKNLGFYKNIESMLYQVSDQYPFVCFSDQDDLWKRTKIEKQLNEIENKKVDIVYSDLTIIDEDREMISPTFWNKRSNHIHDFHALCVNNVATGSTMLFKSSLLENLLPFPQQTGKVYHDHWICASAKHHAKIQYIPEALVHYIQHENNVTGFQKFKRMSLAHRLLSFFSLLNISRKIIFNSNIKELAPFIKNNQATYFSNVQRLKLFYLRFNLLQKEQFNRGITDLKLVVRLLSLSIKSFFKKIYFNRFEVALYTSIIIFWSLKARSIFKKHE